MSGRTLAADFAIKVICYGYGLSRAFRPRSGRIDQASARRRLERDNLAFLDDDFILIVGRISHPITDDLIGLQSKLLDNPILSICRAARPGT